MTREIALHCMKSYSELHSDLCELCPIYGEIGSDHCFEDALQYVIRMLEQESRKGHWMPYLKEGLIVKCSECGSRFSLGYDYCPHCGADMREV